MNRIRAGKLVFRDPVLLCGEVFRMLSFEEIGTSTLQSRAVAGVANNTLIFAMPGSTKACRTAWENIIAPQLDARTRPCNFHPHLKK